MITCPNCQHEIPASQYASPNLRDYGLRVTKWGTHGWVLEWYDDVLKMWCQLQIEGHGGVAPTRTDAVLEAARRIASGQFEKVTA